MVNAADGQILQRVVGHSSGVHMAGFSKCDQYLYTLGVDQRLQKYSLLSKEVVEFSPNCKYYEDMAILTDSIILSGKTFLEHRHDIKREGVAYDLGDTVTAIAASKDCDYLLVNISLTKARIELFSTDDLSHSL